VTPGAEDVPLRRAGRGRVGRDDLDARLDQVVPALDVLRVALADDEGDHRGGDDAPGVGVVLPAVVHQAGVDEALDVGLEGEVDDVGVEATLDGAGLVTGGAVRRLEGDVLARVGALEVLEDGLVGGFEHRVADDAQRVRVGVARATCGGAGGQGQSGDQGGRESGA